MNNVVVCRTCGLLVDGGEIEEGHKPNGQPVFTCNSCRKGDRYKSSKDGLDDKLENIMETMHAMWNHIVHLSGKGESNESRRVKEVQQPGVEEKSSDTGVHGKDAGSSDGEEGTGNNKEVVEK